MARALNLFNMIAFGVILSAIVVLANGANVGRTESARSHPYQVSFREWVRPDPQDEYVHFCSGVVINKNWILSAASCFEDRDVGYAFAAAGTDSLDEEGQTYEVNYVILQDDYETPYNDNLALVRIVGDIEFNEKVQAISLPKSDFTEYDTVGDITGWFTIKEDLTANKKLQEAPLTIISNQECAKSRDVNDKHICGDDRADDFCHEDIGAPLIVDDVVVGIESYVAPCAAGLPDVFTRVYSYSDWIFKILQKFE